MANETYYAWSPIRFGKLGEMNAAGVVKVDAGTVKVGEEVSAGKLGVSEEEFQAYIDSGAVRPQEFPELPENFQDSPINHIRRAVRTLQEEVSTPTGTVNERLLRRTLSGALVVEPEEGETTDEQTQQDSDYELDANGNPVLDDQGNPVLKRRML